MNSHKSDAVETSKIVNALATQRKDERNRFFEEAKQKFEAGSFFPGKAENGKLATTLPLHRLGIYPSKEHVVVTFKREDAKALGEMEKGEVTLLAKQGSLPRMKVKNSMMWIAAVRQSKHVCEGYQKEMETTDKFMNALDTLNIQFAGKKAITDRDIDYTIAALNLFEQDVLSKKRAAVKKIVAKDKLDVLLGKLEEAKVSENRAFTVGTACAIFSAFRDRLGKWRDRDIANLYERGRQRECALRPFRDAWLKGKLGEFAKDPQAAFTKYVLIPDKPEEEEFSPKRVLEELKKNPDSYLWYIIREMEAGMAQFEKRRFTFAGLHFKKAHERL